MISIVLALALHGQTFPVDAVQEAAPSEPTPVSAVAMEVLAAVPADRPERNAAGAVQDFGYLGGGISAFRLAGREDLVEREGGAPANELCTLSDAELDLTGRILASDAQIVIVDGLFSDLRHRAILLDLVMQLAGDFDVFASPIFSPTRVEMGEEGALGAFDREPVFGRAVTAARDNGYEIVSLALSAEQRRASPMDFTVRQVYARNAQARNVVSRILFEDPQARILVYTGLGGAREVELNQFDGGVMASRFEDPDAPGGTLVRGSFSWVLRETTGIDPFTIAQACEPVEADEMEAIRAGANPTTEPLSFRMASWPAQVGTVASEAFEVNLTDLNLAYGLATYTDARPDWRRAIGDVEVAVPDALVPAEGPVVLEVREPYASLETTPVERLLLYPGEVIPLLIPPGDWVITAWTSDGAYGEPVTLSVPAP